MVVNGKKGPRMLKKEQFSGSHSLFKSLPDYVPITIEESEILYAGQMKVLSYYLPAVVRLQNQRLLYSLNKHGFSYHTFFERLQFSEETILIIEDTKGHKFGAYISERMQNKDGFAGNGSSWVFTYHDTEDLQLWQATGMNDMF